MNLLKVFLILNFCVGCSSLRVSTLSPVVESPMVIGESGRIDGRVGLKQNHEYEITENAGARPPNTNEAKFIETADFSLGPQIGILDRADFILDISPVNSALSFGVKFQPLGETVLNRKKGNFVLSVSSNFILSSASQRGDQSTRFGPGGYKYDAQASLSGLGLGVSIGYQPEKNILIYAGVANMTYGMNYKINQEAAVDDAGGVYEGRRNGVAATYAVGLEGGGETSGFVQLQIKELNFENAKFLQDQGVNIGARFRF